MTKATITKTLNKSELKDDSMSIGFRRFYVLPENQKLKLQKHFFLKTQEINYNKTIIPMLQNMTESEYYIFLERL